jgi:D-alanyl-lipoteichoic acid acyltransferase DltB (MBOAT superfamily)
VNFVSYSFAVLFVVVFACRLILGRRKIERPYLGILLVSSLVFYGWHVPEYLAVLLLSAAIDYVAARALGRRPDAPDRWRRTVLAASLATNLGLLAFFKYANFTLSSAASLAEAAGFQPAMPRLDVLLPMGISFYTFQSMSYTIDVYRRRLAPMTNFPAFLLYISFFPQLVAGPIVRAVEFLPQLPRVRRVRLGVVNEGLFLIAGGYFLKMVCADNIAVFVNEHWDAGYEPGANSVALFWLACMFGAQIFCDFAGYSNIARGLALMLGFRLPINFNAPYIAGSFKNFWERWHITLSSWLRDYLYVSLGGNRISRVRTYVNLLTVMVLGGLWHGAAWTFVVWGTLHGAALAVERALGLHRVDIHWAGRVMWWVVVQTIVLVTWIFFRSDDVAGAWQFILNIAALEYAAPNEVMRFGSWFLVPPLLMHAWRLLEERGLVPAVTGYGKAALTGILIFFIVAAYGPTNAFIYFQF